MLSLCPAAQGYNTETWNTETGKPISSLSNRAHTMISAGSALQWEDASTPNFSFQYQFSEYGSEALRVSFKSKALKAFQVKPYWTVLCPGQEHQKHARLSRQKGSKQETSAMSSSS